MLKEKKKTYKKFKTSAKHEPEDRPEHQIAPLDACPFCFSYNIKKSGTRKNKYGKVQLYECKDCDRRFTPLLTRHKTYPLNTILAAITLYNRLHTFENAAKAVSEKYGITISATNIRRWIAEFKEYLPFLRMRDFIKEKFNPKDIIEKTHLLHGQIYDFQYHKAKTQLILEEDFKHLKLKPLRDFLDIVVAECPHQIFRNSKYRASEFKNIFNLNQVRITPKVNVAVKNAALVLQAVSNNKMRHEAIQEFMISNDSVTVATEVPVLLDSDDIRHFKTRLGFDVPIEIEEGEVITGHIDILQIRNGVIHIMDYKPSAKKAKPIEQLTIYALALSRLTTLKLYNFKCAWFDKDNYYEFYPLHVVYKKKKKGKTKSKKETEKELKK